MRRHTWRPAFLAVREPGGPDRASSGLGPDGGLPRTQTAGRFLALPGAYFPGLAREVTPDQLPDAREEVRASGAWAKVIGDAILTGSGFRRGFDAEELREAAAQVHDVGGRIAIHTMFPDVVHDAVEAGFDSIEHGMGMLPEQVSELERAGVAWVPTLGIGEQLPALMASVGASDGEARDWANRIDHLPEIVRLAVEAGVTVLAGTDAGMVPHGRIREEIRLLLACGLSSETAIGAGSWTARAWLGYPGIEEGAPADLVAFHEDPTKNPEVLAEPAVVILDGRLVVPAEV